MYKFKDEISKYQHLIEQEHKKIKELPNVHRKDKDVLTEVINAENRIHDYYLHKLKCNSDYLFKALSVWEKPLDIFKSNNISLTEDLDDSTYDIDLSEMADFAADVLSIKE